MKKVSREEALESVKKIIRYIGDDPEREGLADTPERVIKSFDHLYSGYKANYQDFFLKTFESKTSEMVVLTDIELYSTCEHHMLPFYGKCHIGYIPNGRVIGISKLARLMEVFSRRLQIQEELCYQIAKTLFDGLSAIGVGVVIEAKHMCMTCRGVEKQNSFMTSSTLLGTFRSDPRTRSEFLNFINNRS